MFVSLGDLNIHRTKKGKTSDIRSIDNWINNIIDSAGLMDMGYVGSNYTWSNRLKGKGYKRARIDMALHNSQFQIDYPDSKVFHLPFLASDHCPLLLITETEGYKPRNNWKFNRCWLQDPTCNEIISKSWFSSKRF